LKAIDIANVDYIAKIESGPVAFDTTESDRFCSCMPKILRAARQKLDRFPSLSRHFSSTNCRRRNGEIHNGEIHMPKTLLSQEELKARAFEAIRQCAGCDGVSDVTIYEIDDDSSPSNWGIGAIGADAGCATAATRAAVYVQQELQEQFDLLSAL